MTGVKLNDAAAVKVQSILEEVARTLQGLEDKLNLLDSGCGDGDCGSTHAVGAKGKPRSFSNSQNDFIVMFKIQNT